MPTATRCACRKPICAASWLSFASSMLIESVPFDQRRVAGATPHIALARNRPSQESLSSRRRPSSLVDGLHNEDREHGGFTAAQRKAWSHGESITSSGGVPTVTLGRVSPGPQSHMAWHRRDDRRTRRYR